MSEGRDPFVQMARYDEGCRGWLVFAEIYFATDIGARVPSASRRAPILLKFRDKNVSVARARVDSLHLRSSH